jgi:pilus assembly protein CpaF
MFSKNPSDCFVLRDQLISELPTDSRIVSITENPDEDLQKIYTDHDIITLHHSSDVSVEVLLKMATRYNPKYVVLDQLKGREAFDVLKLILIGYSVVTIVNADSAKQVFERVHNWINQNHNVNISESELAQYIGVGLEISSAQQIVEVVDFKDFK